MTRPSLHWLSGHLLGQRRSTYIKLLVLAAALELAAGTGLGYVAGFADVRRVLLQVSWPWLFASVAALAVSFAGYFGAYREIYRMADGPRLTLGQMAAVVIGGFGGFVAHGGSALDDYVLRCAGADQRDSRVRVSALAGLEHGVLAIVGTAAGITVLAEALQVPNGGFTIPWAVVPIPGFLLAFWLAERYRDRFRGRPGWRDKVGIFLDAIHMIRELFVRPRQHGIAVWGMGLFWVADAFAMWTALAAFGFRMNLAALLIGYATGMLFSRRTGPIGGAGILMLALGLAVWYSGAPLAGAVVAVFAYRVAAFWLPVPFALVAVPTLHRMGRPAPAPAGDLTS